MNDYRTALRERFEERKKRDPELTFNRMAERMRVQPPYLSKALNRSAHLSTDQLYLACEYIGIGAKDREYLGLLLEYGRSALPERKTQLEHQIRRHEARTAQTEEHIETKPLTVEMNDATEYYLDPLFQIVHIFVSIPKYAQKPELIATDLAIPIAKIRFVLRRLAEMKIVTLDRNGKVAVVVQNIHLPAKSPLCRPHQHLIRMATMQRLETLPADRAYNLAITFSADAEARARIQKLFLDFLKQFDTIVEKAPSEDVFQMNFDLFSWK